MEQRRLRLGDILDDYCPRERRVTNHAVVAMVEEDVKQTRCTTCDAEHVYKGGREPRRRKKAETGALYREVLAGMPDTEIPHGNNGGHVAADVPAPARSAPEVAVAAVAAIADNSKGAQPLLQDHAAEDGGDAPLNDTEAVPVEEGPVHRPLIRATLPRPEGQKEIRQVTDFTVRHRNGGRDNAPFRAERSQPRGGAGAANGGRPGPRRFAGGGAGPGSGSGGPGRGGSPSRGGGFRGANGPQRPDGQGGAGGPRGKKRSR
ncbi:MAG: hypothetical protein ABIS06_18040 [Vicinamibacterales bacterium]